MKTPEEWLEDPRPTQPTRNCMNIDLNQLAQETANQCNDPNCLTTDRKFIILRALEAAEGKQKLAEAMINLGLATGHGESLEDLLNELEWQFKELRMELTTSRAIVDRIWTALGISTYEQDKPLSIDEYVTTLYAREERLREALGKCVNWITNECRPGAEWSGQGHNMCMSEIDREIGREIMELSRQTLAGSQEANR